MFAFAPSIQVPSHGTARFAKASTSTRVPRTAVRAALRPGWGVRPSFPRQFEPVPVAAAPAELAVELAAPAVPLAPAGPPASLPAGASLSEPLPAKMEVELKRATLLQRLLQSVVRLSRSMKSFRERHARSIGVLRLGIFALVAVSFFARGGISAVASTSGTSVAAASGTHATALPGVFRSLPISERLLGAIRPFSESFGVVFLSEFGDKSMFATALMAMKHSPVLVLIGALAALTVMTLIACFLGQLMHLLPSTVTHYSSIALFVFFGIQMIMQSRNLPSTPGGKGGERADAEELVSHNAIATKQSPFAILAKISSLIFVAEWCDRSMIATMALAASSNSLAVVGGATLANVVCTGFAVGAAALVASKISERTVALIAGILFEFFAVFTWFEGPES